MFFPLFPLAVVFSAKKKKKNYYYFFTNDVSVPHIHKDIDTSHLTPEFVFVLFIFISNMKPTSLFGNDAVHISAHVWFIYEEVVLCCDCLYLFVCLFFSSEQLNISLMSLWCNSTHQVNLLNSTMWPVEELDQSEAWSVLCCCCCKNFKLMLTIKYTFLKRLLYWYKCLNL